ncbi:glycosyltransferase family 2 protein [Halobacteriovorax sp.]|uniref:glycosyltransferase family 2 protein n=1 Tax=Halobacteriovorax sp. TaxID=2020862 RepID=UPI003AF24435
MSLESTNIFNNLSVIILSSNNEGTIERTLESVKDFKKIILIDDYSSDATLDIAKRYENLEVVQNKFEGFTAQRNFGLSVCESEWCFFIDSDEAVTAELIDHLKKLDVENNIDSIRVYRTEYLDGKEISHGQGHSSYQKRIHRTKNVTYKGEVHEWPEFSGQDRLIPKDFRLLHYPDRDLHSIVTKVHKYAKLRGDILINKNSRTNIFKIVLLLNWHTFRLLLASIGTGWRGNIEVMMSVAERLIANLYLYEDQKLKKEKRND